MIVPRNRLLFWFAAIGVPFSVLAGVLPASAAVCLGVILLLILVAAWDAWHSRKGLSGINVTVPPVSRLALEKEGAIELCLHNESRRDRTLRLALPLPEEFVTPYEELKVTVPRENVWSRFSWTCQPRKRGKYLLEAAHVEAPSSLGFWNIRKRLSVQGEIRVYPNLNKDRKELGLIYRGAYGTHAHRQIGKGREFEKLRDYVPGDGSEDIHWKASARRGRPVTKVFQIERTQEVYVALDASRLSAREDAIERHISTALLIGAAAERQGDLFGLLSFSDRVENFVRARNGVAHYNACRDAIYALQPRQVNPDFDEVCSFIRLRLRRRALVIILTALDDPVLAENFVRHVEIISRQHLVVVGMMKPTGIAPLFSNPNVSNPEELYDELGGHLRWHNLEEVSRLLQRRGIKLAIFDREHMGLRLVSEYLNIKKRQVL
jgi:uncharacterized protein (DUF58 family)